MGNLEDHLDPGSRNELGAEAAESYSLMRDHFDACPPCQVAAVAGALLGARWGATAIPSSWRRMLHDRWGRTAQGLERTAHAIVRRASLATPCGSERTGAPEPQS